MRRETGAILWDCEEALTSIKRKKYGTSVKDKSSELVNYVFVSLTLLTHFTIYQRKVSRTIR